MAPYLPLDDPSQSPNPVSSTASSIKRSHETMSRSAILVQRETHEDEICAGKLISGRVADFDCNIKTSDNDNDYPRLGDRDAWDPGWSIAGGVLLVLILGGLLFWVYKERKKSHARHFGPSKEARMKILPQQAAVHFQPHSSHQSQIPVSHARATHAKTPPSKLPMSALKPDDSVSQAGIPPFAAIVPHDNQAQSHHSAVKPSPAPRSTASRKERPPTSLAARTFPRTCHRHQDGKDYYEIAGKEVSASVFHQHEQEKMEYMRKHFGPPFGLRPFE